MQYENKEFRKQTTCCWWRKVDERLKEYKENLYDGSELDDALKRGGYWRWKGTPY